MGFEIEGSLLRKYVEEPGVTQVAIPDGITVIGKGAFSRCTGLTAVRIPPGVTRIGSGAFSRCTHLRSAPLPQGLTAIGLFAFLDCASLTEVFVPPGVTVLPGQGGMNDGGGDFRCCSGVFEGCSSLESLVLPEGLRQIGIRAFSECRRLEHVTIPASVESIGIMAFCACQNLKSVTFLGRVREIGWGAFCQRNLRDPLPSLERIVIPAMPAGAEKDAFVKIIRRKISPGTAIVESVV